MNNERKGKVYLKKNGVCGGVTSLQQAATMSPYKLFSEFWETWSEISEATLEASAESETIDLRALMQT